MPRLGIVLSVILLAFAGCGGVGGTDRPNEEASLLLDFTPNGVHAGIYLATARDFDDAEGVQLDVRAPGVFTSSVTPSASS